MADDRDFNVQEFTDRLAAMTEKELFETMQESVPVRGGMTL